MPTHEVWYLIGSLSRGGTSLTLVDIANNVDHDEFDVTVWTLLDDTTLAAELDPAVEVKTLAATGKHDLPAIARFLANVRRAQPDVVQSFLFFDNMVARAASVVAPRSTVVTGVRVVPNDRSRLRALADRLTVGLADHVVSNSRAGKEFAIDLGVSPDAVSVIYNGRDSDVYGSATPSPELRESLRIPAGVPLIGTVGRLIERKGIYDILDAWPAILDAEPDAHFLFVGDGPEFESLRGEVLDRGFDDSITLAGHREDIPEMLALMNLFVFPSHYEGLPGAVVEAMAAGMPIVATDVDGNGELLTHEETGLLIPPHDPEALARAVTRLLSSPVEARAYGSAARETARGEFSIERMAVAFQGLYRDLLDY